MGPKATSEELRGLFTSFIRLFASYTSHTYFDIWCAKSLAFTSTKVLAY
jgi:hypothetical protein